MNHSRISAGRYSQNKDRLNFANLSKSPLNNEKDKNALLAVLNRLSVAKKNMSEKHEYSFKFEK